MDIDRLFKVIHETTKAEKIKSEIPEKTGGDRIVYKEGG